MKIGLKKYTSQKEVPSSTPAKVIHARVLPPPYQQLLHVPKVIHARVLPLLSQQL